MQSIFRLPWCSDQLIGKVADKPAVDKMRPSPVVEIPLFHKLKRMRSDSTESQSPPQQTKKRRRDHPADPQQRRTRAPSAEKDEIPNVASHQGHIHPRAATGACSHSQTAAAFTGLATAPSGDPALALATPDQDRHTPLVDPRGPGADAGFLMTAPSPDVDMTEGLTRLQQVIENECNLQILLKHNELRLIEQELAKCQIALEQLRRCELRPYPGVDAPLESISTGTGPSIAPRPGYSLPSHPAPYGVTDGPYSRHYRQWLLHDPQFDSVPLHMLSHYELSAHAAARSTRNSGSAKQTVAKTPGTPARPADFPQSIPNYPSAPKDKSAPLVLKRSTDGQLVKLICNNCHRGNFSSIQGFLNHCRIAHKVDYKSHDSAAIDCGRPLDESEVANLRVESHVSHHPKPSTARASIPAAATPLRNLVHPLNTAVAAARPIASVSPASATATPARGIVSQALPSLGPEPFKPSMHVPRLSAHFAKHKLGGNLEQATASAMQKVDLGWDDELPSPDTPDMHSPVAPMAGTRTVAGTTGFGMPGAQRPPSRKGHRQPAQPRHRPSPLAPTELSESSDHLDVLPSPHASSTLSPHAADSNPGLVSDHEDDDHGSVSEVEVPHSDDGHPLPPVPRHCSDHMDIDDVEDEEMSRHGVVIRRNSMTSTGTRDLRSAGSPSRKLKKSSR